MAAPPPVAPEPDTKDWTWTLQRPCPECGLDVSELSLDEVADRLELDTAEWLQVLTGNPAATARPAPAVWSPLEYGAHVRDALLIFDTRLARMITEDEPTFDNWDQDGAALDAGYAGLDPDEVAEELVAAASTLVERLRAVTDDQQSRRGLRSNGSEFTVLTLSRYLLHDVAHHLWDVTGLPAAS